MVPQVKIYNNLNFKMANTTNVMYCVTLHEKYIAKKLTKDQFEVK